MKRSDNQKIGFIFLHLSVLDKNKLSTTCIALHLLALGPSLPFFVVLQLEISGGKFAVKSIFDQLVSTALLLCVFLRSDPLLVVQKRKVNTTFVADARRCHLPRGDLFCRRQRNNDRAVIEVDVVRK